MKYLRFIPSILIVSVIWYLSDQPGLKSEYTPIVDFFLRKGAHIFEYFLLYLALFWGFLNTKIEHLTKNEINFIHSRTFILGFISTLLDEWHQTWVLGREGKPIDIIFDSIGFLIAYILIWTLWIYYRKAYAIHSKQ